MVIYADLVMGLNFLVDLFLFLGTNRLAGFPRCSLYPQEPLCARSVSAL